MLHTQTNTALAETTPFALTLCAQSATPIVKWAGGKGRLLSQLRPLLPSGIEHMRHIEPFAGGAALFFDRFSTTPAYAGRTHALLCDSNPDLIALYQCVRDDLPALQGHLLALARRHSPDHFYAIRTAYNAREHACAAQRAAMFLYLNRTCFNGLHRVNRRGQFNVPIGRYKNPRILDVDLLNAARLALAGVDLRCGDFATTLQLARPGDFVYLDPPYQPTKKTANFTAYAKAGFAWTDQVRLRDTFAELDERDCYLMLSNSDTPEVRRLYADYRVDEVWAPRSINSRATGRKRVGELVIRNY